MTATPMMMWRTKVRLFAIIGLIRRSRWMHVMRRCSLFLLRFSRWANTVCNGPPRRVVIPASSPAILYAWNTTSHHLMSSAISLVEAVCKALCHNGRWRFFRKTKLYLRGEGNGRAYNRNFCNWRFASLEDACLGLLTFNLTWNAER